ncbi:response regulator [Marinobacter sp. SS21]|uniref:response regulator n=1 Tax=Marinobacter sp. SS21 TaxID=2979460 RepID=UPI00232D17FB|nr:response regulator [Marinobacter sp. SS21]MDC0663440.1 response regulator [Marinobacter sp. SS21]
MSDQPVPPPEFNEPEAHADAYRRFRYRITAVLGFIFINVLLYTTVFENRAVVLIFGVWGAIILLLALWAITGKEVARLDQTSPAAFIVSILALVAASAVTGFTDSNFIWYLLLAPAGAALLHSSRLSVIAFMVTVLVLFLLKSIEIAIDPGPRQAASFETLFVQVILLSTITYLGIVSRNASDAFIQKLQKARAKSHEAERKAILASQAKSGFLASMSHEIRTPLNGVIGVNRLLQETSLNDEQRSLVAMGKVASESLLHLVNEILDLSRIEAGKMELESVPFDFSQVVSSVVTLLQDSASRKSLAVTVDSTLEKHIRLMGDPLRLRQVLLNLASNAVKFTSSGLITIKCRKVTQKDKDIRVRIDVIDTGPGMSEADQARLFSVYSQTRESIAREFGGSGLGLAISRQLTELMGGDIGVNSALNVGSTFWVEIPFSMAETALAEEKALSESREAIPRTSLSLIEPPKPLSGCVLVAEDNNINQIIVRKMLERFGLSVRIVEDGRQALEAARSERYDLIILDCQMPVMDGFEACKAIRSLEQAGNRQPIVALTASAFKDDQAKCLAAGMDDFLTKPIDAGRLYVTLEKWLD